MKKIYITLICMCLSAFAVAQQVSTLYFLDNAPMRHYLNPSYQPLSDVYISLPVIGYTDFWAGNNSFSMKDILYKNSAGQTITALHPTGDKSMLLDAMKSSFDTNVSSRVNLLSFGWRRDKAYWHVDMNLRVDGLVGLPKDVFDFALMGMDDLSQSSTVDLGKLGANVNAYAELGVGYSREINSKITVGGKVKYLYGIANASMRNTSLGFDASLDEWKFNGAGAAYLSANFIDYPSTIAEFDELFDEFTMKSDASISDYISPAGSGFAIDLGVTYKPIDMLTLSLSLTDLGFISWSGKKYSYSVAGKYDGVGNLNFDELNDGALTDTIFSRLKSDFSNSFHDDGVKDKYSLMISPRLNIGAEANFWENKVGVGLHSMTQFVGSKVQQEITLGANLRPVNWFNFAASYSFLNGRFSSIGAGIGLRGGPLNLTLAADYIPFTYADYSASPTSIVSVPYKVKGVNLAVGLTIVIGNNQDKDKDGVSDKFDLCPDTPREAKVDEKGCPLDTDNDGVPDYLDKCAGTSAEAAGKVDAHGCPLDSDGDGVPDYLDVCPDTPKEAHGQIDEFGCPIDTDGDSVPDYLDKCSTPVQAIGFVDADGCPLDSDGDGVPDYLDKCSDTPAEAAGQIDEHGCPLDSDGDGVPDYLDKCPNTLPEAAKFVDSDGCDKDTDYDGIPDYKDACIRTAGVASNNGCPEVNNAVRKLFARALQGISFTTGRSIIKSSSYPVLNDIANVLLFTPAYNVEIQGHTDNVGKPELNKALSERRANAVRDYLIKKGVPKHRMTAVGYGDTKPVMSNSTSAGRAKNRRVEFVVSFEDTVIE